MLYKQKNGMTPEFFKKTCRLLNFVDITHLTTKIYLSVQPLYNAVWNVLHVHT